MKNVIFYFSGTGNSLQVARDIAMELGDCEVLNIAKCDTGERVAAERVGFVFPVYFWGIPNILKAFLKKIEFKSNPYLFAVATFGGTFGASLNQVNDLLREKNRKLHSGFAVRMPENYIMSYNVEDEEMQQTLFKNEKEKVAAIGKVVAGKKEQPLQRRTFSISGLIGKPINEISLKNFATKDKNFNLSNSCTGCGLCAKKCPVHNIELVGGKPEWNHHCELCLACLQNCPAQAINYRNSTQKRKRYVNPNV
jgi:ferredoxin